MADVTFPACETCGADANELCGKGCPSEATRGTNETPLAKAVEYLGAVEVAPGRYAYYAAGDSEWRILKGAASLDGLYEAVTMPPWWSPSQRFAARFRGGNRPAASAFAAECLMPEDAGPCDYVITVDLTTGEEVPA